MTCTATASNCAPELAGEIDVVGAAARGRVQHPFAGTKHAGTVELGAELLHAGRDVSDLVVVGDELATQLVPAVAAPIVGQRVIAAGLADHLPRDDHLRHGG